jgi:hypothetical protein
MGALIGFFTDYQQSKWLDQLLSNVTYVPPTTLYLGLLTSRPSRLNASEVVTTQTLTGFTDFIADATDNTRISSPSHPFTAADQKVVITGGTGWAKTTYTINSLIGTTASLATSPATAGTTGGKGNIIRSTGYARVALPSGLFDATVNGRTQNNAAITLPAPTGDWGEVKAFGIYDALTGGNMLAMIATANSTVISAGDASRTIAAGALIVSRT